MIVGVFTVIGPIVSKRTFMGSTAIIAARGLFTRSNTARLPCRWSRPKSALPHACPEPRRWVRGERYWPAGIIAPIALAWALLLLSGCASSPKTAPIDSGLSQRIVDYALSLDGSPYAYGKSSPEEGFDCSGFVWHVYRKNGLTIPRTAGQMASTLPEVDPDSRRPSDLLFFHTEDKPFSHVALYLGNDAFIHAPSSKTGRVMVSHLENPYWRRHLSGVRRPIAGGSDPRDH